MRPNPDGGIRKPSRSGNSTSSNPTQPASAVSNSANGPKARVITSCLTCRRRKVKCDHKRPICGACTRGNRTCRYDAQLSTVSIPVEDAFELRERIEKLEELLIKAAVAAGTGKTISVAGDIQQLGPRKEEEDDDDDGVPTERIGRLLLRDEKAVFVGPVHWTMLTDQVKELRSILEDNKCQRANGLQPMDEEDCQEYGLANGSAEDEDEEDDTATYIFGSAAGNMQRYQPSVEQCHKLFELFMKNVEPMVRICHKPTLKENFNLYLELVYGDSSSPADSTNSAGDSGFYNSNKSKSGSSTPASVHLCVQNPAKLLNDLEPLVMAMFFGAAVSIKSEESQEYFGVDSKVLQRRYKRATERALANAKFMVNPDLKVLQGFVMYLTLLFKEDDDSTTWPLTGLAIRIAQALGLHREPTLFTGQIDVVQVEVRRRLWSHICYLDFRAAEGNGQEVMILEDSFDTKLPTNIEDDELIKGQKPEDNPRVMKASQESDKVTGMTMGLVRYNGIRVLRKLLNGTAKIRRKPRTEELCLEEEKLALDLQSELREASTRNARLHLSFCTESTPLQRLIALLGRIMEWKFWISFYNRFSKSYREKVMNMDMRRAIFATSTMLLQCTSFAYPGDAGDFGWHVDSHTQFHAIAHVLGELCSAKFQTVEDNCLRARGWMAIEVCRKLNADKRSRAWSLVRRMISAAEKYRDTHLLNCCPGTDALVSQSLDAVEEHIERQMRAEAEVQLAQQRQDERDMGMYQPAANHLSATDIEKLKQPTVASQPIDPLADGPVVPILDASLVSTLGDDLSQTTAWAGPAPQTLLESDGNPTYPFGHIDTQISTAPIQQIQAQPLFDLNNFSAQDSFDLHHPAVSHLPTAAPQHQNDHNIFPTFDPPVADEFIVYHPPDAPTSHEDAFNHSNSNMDWNANNAAQPEIAFDDFDLNMPDFDMANWDPDSGSYMMMFFDGNMGGFNGGM
ncbi:hypothetical protein BJ508DRAFT_306352 [Ascobolus immersus RN42]|uniref:Zn(2)-C6 fungal-type domain-containing protein n=1 Tax=Ascobolus immersus RN42 TaxID=1160509 RepID=A0A3N4I8E7_ASCIM|nr:hypothetical protein BJ508DRAFT_306352 [Ascobolus immersus RN42]